MTDELTRWRRTFAGDTYYYGDDAGPVARRAVRYDSRPGTGRTALDAGCGEGQDLVFLAEQGYRSTGLDFTPEGAKKTIRLLQMRGQSAQVLQRDLAQWDDAGTFDVVLAVNVLQFLGAAAEAVLDRLMDATASGGTLGLSMFAAEAEPPHVAGTVYFTTLEHLLRRFATWQPHEAAQLWQWNAGTGRPQAFVTLIARKT